MSRPRLIQLTTTDISLELLLGPQLSAFVDAGYEVIGVSAPGDFVEAIEARGVRHVPLVNATRAMAPHQDLAAIGELTRLFRRLRPDIVHTHNPKPGLYGRIAARAARVPVVVNTVHGLYAMPEDRLAKRAVVYSLERLASTCSDAELVQNPEDLVTLRRVLREPAAKLTLLGNGVDLTRFAEHADRAAVRERVRAELGVGDGRRRGGCRRAAGAREGLRRAVRGVGTGPGDASGQRCWSWSAPATTTRPTPFLPR